MFLGKTEIEKCEIFLQDSFQLACAHDNVTGWMLLSSIINKNKARIKTIEDSCSVDISEKKELFCDSLENII